MMTMTILLIIITLTIFLPDHDERARDPTPCFPQTRGNKKEALTMFALPIILVLAFTALGYYQLARYYGFIGK